MRVSGGHARQTQEQIKDYLLCSACELLRSKDEKYVSEITYQRNGIAPIFDHVLRQGEVAPGAPTRAYPTPSLDCEKILRFGAGTLFLAHLSNKAPKCRLRPVHAEAFRLYLLGTPGFPTDAVCLVHFIEDRAGQPSPIPAGCS